MTELELAQKRANDLNTKLDEFKSLVEAKASKEDISEAISGAFEGKTIKEVMDSIVEVKELADEIGLQVGELKNVRKENESNDLGAIIKENYEASVSAVKSNRRDMHEFTVSEKALATVSAVTSTRSYRDNELVPLDARRMVMQDLWRHVSIGKDSAGTIVYIDWDTATTARAAAAVAEGLQFPESTVAWEEKSILMKKIGDSIPVTEEFVVDQSRFAGEIQAFLGQNVQLELDNQLLLGDGTGANILGLDAKAPVFTPVNRGFTAPTLYDLVPILRETIVKGKGNKFAPNFLMMNITEINKYKLEKDANNNYIMPPFVSASGDVIDGILVIENNNVADNTLYIGDSRHGRIYDAAEGYTLSVGYVDDQFTGDIKTLKARKRTCLLIKDSEAPGYLKVADIAAAIAALAV